MAAAMGGVIKRDPAGAASEQFDLLVIGGGIYGISLAFEASRRGLKPILLERQDFGSGTTWNNLRIIHGGLRHLQRFDLARSRESSKEQRWFLQAFPDLVRPLPCIMPIYGRGLRRSWIFEIALRLNDLLSGNGKDAPNADRRLPRGRVLSARETVARLPQVATTGLKGGALWFDAAMPDSQRVLIEMARWSASRGARLLNYVDANRLLTHDGAVKGVEAIDVISGRSWVYRANIVVNCAGPWCREIARRFDRDIESLFRPSLAFNLLLDRAPLSEAALAIDPPHSGARSYFLLAWKGKVLAGTYHAPRPAGFTAGPPGEELVRRFLEDLNTTVPALRLNAEDVLKVFWGVLPAASPGTIRLAVKENIHDHGKNGGPRGFFSVVGVKFTTARKVGEKTLNKIYGSLDDPESQSDERPSFSRDLFWDQFRALLSRDSKAAGQLVDRIVEEEAVVCLEDLLVRRTDWGLHPDAPPEIGAKILDLRPMLRTAAVTSDRSSGGQGTKTSGVERRERG